MPPAVYELHGLRVRSQVPLVGRAAAPGAPVDLDIVLGPAGRAPGMGEGRLIVERRVGGDVLYTGSAGPSAYLLTVTGHATFAVDRDLTTVVVHPDASGDSGIVPILLAGLVLAFVLELAGACVLHASAVEVGGRAVALAGGSGSGKSTLAALLAATGAPLVTDDLLRVEPGGPDGGPPRGHVGGPQLRLRPAATGVLDRFPTRPPAHETADGRLAIAPPSAAGPTVPLGTVLVPALSRTAGEVSLRRLPAADAVACLAAFPRVEEWSDDEVRRRRFRQLVGVATSVGVHVAEIPWSHPVRPDLGAQLRDRLALTAWP